jgi:tetratricopeptide (TPR) repeat protein
MLNKTAVVMAIIICAVGAGCQSHSENKKLAEMRFRKASTEIKLNLAQQQYDERRFDEAKKTVSECIKEDPWVSQAHLLSGKLLLREGQCDEATNELTLALELDEKLVDGWYWLGLASEEKGDYQQAHNCYSKAMNLAPGNVDYILAVAGIYAVQDKNERAIKLYEQAMLITGNSEAIAESLGYCYLFSDKWSKAAEIFNELVTRCQDEQKKKQYLEAAALCSINCAQYGKAVSCYDELSVTERSNAEIWVKMGQAALGTAAADRAFVCGQKALALQPGYADAIVLIGCAQYAGGAYGLAAKSFEKTASDKKNGGFSWMMRAKCYEQLGKTKKAKRAYKRALEINPHSELGNFLARGKHKLES